MFQGNNWQEIWKIKTKVKKKQPKTGYYLIRFSLFQMGFELFFNRIDLLVSHKVASAMIGLRVMFENLLASVAMDPASVKDLKDYHQKIVTFIKEVCQMNQNSKEQKKSPNKWVLPSVCLFFVMLFHFLYITFNKV